MPSLPTRPLGRNGPLVSAIGYGAMSLGGVYNTTTPDSNEHKLAVLDHAYEIGERFWDTADVYFDSEDRIGDWFRKTGKRDEIFLASKFAITFDEKRIQTVHNDREYMRAACERSLKRLGVETIDLYYCHRVDGKTPIEKTVEAMAELKREGKIRYLGLSEVSADTIRRAHAVHPITAVQVEYSLFTLDIEKARVLQTCRELGIAVVAYSPVGRGLLTGQVRSYDDLGPNDWRRHVPKYAAENFPKILALVDKINRVAQAHGCTNAQVCLAWLLAQGDDVFPIPGTRTPSHLDENVQAASIKLTDDEVRELRRYAEETELIGDRYPGQ
ncbi:hypothetical protein VTK73DRAFT_3931 [Phialemonium thermophilum]|uniref:NADP-dependent oxidoreductase domain-containing protein n=1 Tax=Phialemonium thermophilum TaxID=223376 RepID=A0ABR3VD51_9PEZI